MSIEISSFISPAQIQADITLLGVLTGGLISPETKAVISQLGNDLLSLAEDQVTVAEVDALVTEAKLKVPASDAAIVSAIVNGGVAVLNLAIEKFDGHNPEIVAYAEAIANGLIAVAG